MGPGIEEDIGAAARSRQWAAAVGFPPASGAPESAGDPERSLAQNR